MAEGGHEVDEELLVKRGATSTIWNWFGYRKSDAEQTTVICQICRKTVVTKSGNTSNLFHHLKHKHKPEYEESLKIREAMEAPTTSGPRGKKIPTQTKIARAFANCVPYDKKSKRWNELTEAVVLCLAKDMLPLQTVEKEGFKRMIHKLDPRYNMSSRKYFSKTALPAMYEECRGRVQNSIVYGVFLCFNCRHVE